MPSTIVIYHKNCSDGFCAAWLFSKAYPDATFIAAQYGDSPPPTNDDDQVFILDFSYPRDVMLQMKGKLLVLDHHKTAQAACEGLEFCVFDMNKSGARLAYDWLIVNQPRGAAWTVTESLVNYVQDRDLWQHKLPHSKEINAAIRSYDFTFANWDAMCNGGLFALRDEGKAILRYRDNLIASHVAKATEVDICGHKVLQVCCTVGELISDIGEQLATDRKFGVVYSDDANHRTYSLRSRNGFDVSTLAKGHGGGGHQAAAGFRLPLDAVYV